MRVPPEIYLDHQATTPLDPRVLDAMLPWLRGPANAGSAHAHGRTARAALDEAREHVAELLGTSPGSVIWTSGATEANNLALLGVAASASATPHIVSSRIEHPAVLEPIRALADSGVRAEHVAVDGQGNLDVDAVARLAHGADVISTMAANNEVGTLADLDRIAAIADACGALLHTDAAQAAGKVSINAVDQGIDLISISGHKMHGPQGIGALIVSARARPRLRSVVYGGGQEEGLRSGTVFVAGAVGLGAACRLAHEAVDREPDRLRGMAMRLLDRLRALIPDLELVGPPVDERLPGNLCVRIDGVPADALAARSGVACSAGSACSTAASGPSHVLRALGLEPEHADECVRLGVGRFTTNAEVDRAASFLADSVSEIRQQLSVVVAG